MHAARAAFQHIRNRGNQHKAQRKLSDVMQNGFAFERDDAQAALGEKRKVGEDGGIKPPRYDFSGCLSLASSTINTSKLNPINTAVSTKALSWLAAPILPR